MENNYDSVCKYPVFVNTILVKFLKISWECQSADI